MRRAMQLRYALALLSLSTTRGLRPSASRAESRNVAGVRCTRVPSSVMQLKPGGKGPLQSSPPPIFGTTRSMTDTAPLIALMLVPLAWGTYGPSVKSIYSLDAPPPELAFNWMNYIVSSSALALATLAGRQLATMSVDGAEAPEPTTAPIDKAALLAGLELGGYLFAGSTLQIFGLRYTSAGRAAFIVQLTTVLVPLLDGILNGQMPRRSTLLACMLAFVGVSLLITAQDGGVSAMGGLAALLATESALGDALVGLSAVVYSLHVVRLSYHAPRFQPVVLARAKELSRVLYSTGVLIAGVAFSASQAGALRAFLDSFTSAPTSAATAVAIIVWNGVVTTAFPTWAQSFGQSTVSAGAAQVIYSLQPLWSSLFAFLLLGETFSTQGTFGAAAILAAVLVAGLDERGGRQRAGD